MTKAFALPPGPGRLQLARWARLLGRDALGAFTKLHDQFGDVVYLPLPLLPVCLVRDPEMIGRILLDSSGDVVKLRELKRTHYSMVFGRGLFVSDGAYWHRHRVAATKAMRKRAAESEAAVVVAAARRMIDAWRDGEARDLYDDTMILALDVALRSMAGVAAGDALPQICADFRFVMEYFSSQSSVRRLAEMIIPGYVHPDFKRAIARLNAVVHDAVQQRRSAPGDDVLSHLLAGDDHFAEDEIRDETMNLILGAHEPIALAVTWTCALLAQHQDVQEALAAELRTTLGDRAPSIADLSQLPLLSRVLTETLRLYPPIPGVGREARRDYEVGPYRVPKATQLIMNQWVTHRDARLFPEPGAFRPERWENVRTNLPRYAYFPFGGGQRLCIGKNVAELQIMLVLATLLVRFRFTPATDAMLERTPSMMLRPLRARLIISSRP